jgi:hypothetical protein
MQYGKIDRRSKMGLFGKLVATTINVATLPVAFVKDIITLGNAANAGSCTAGSYTGKKIQQIKDEAK